MTRSPPLDTPLLLRAAARLPVAATPVWFMRQAGRYLPEYRAVRSRATLLEVCGRPDLAAEVTLQPVTRLGVDAAILFADILLPLVPMGLALDFVAGEGPQIANPIRCEADLRGLRQVDVPSDLGAVLETIRLVRQALPPAVPLIGFAGMPFTVATYAIEGGPSRHLVETRRLMTSAPRLWDGLMRRLVDMLGDFLVAQVQAGAQVVQLFDSWVGQLDEADYRRQVLPWSRALMARLAGLGVPRIHFGVGADHLLIAMREAGGEVIGLDWRTPLDAAWRRLGDEVALQGNLEPTALLAPLPELRRRVFDILDRAAGRPGHLFNLGHGVLPGTPVERVRAVVELVREHAARKHTA